MKLLIAIIVVILAAAAWWRRSPIVTSPQSVNPSGVVLRASEQGSDQNERRFVLAYQAGDFRFSYTRVSVSSDQPFAMTRGTLARGEGSNAALLVALAEMHGGALPPVATARVAQINVGVAMLGEHLTRAEGNRVVAGEFTSDVPGAWLVTKLFFPVSDPDAEQPEIFLAIDVESGRAEFLMKDPEYWPALGALLATLL